MQKLVRVVQPEDISTLNSELENDYVVVGTYPAINSDGTTIGFDYLIEKDDEE
jgi:hypothetical protein